MIAATMPLASGLQEWVVIPNDMGTAELAGGAPSVRGTSREGAAAGVRVDG